MFTNVEILHQNTHLDLRYNNVQGYEYARKILHAPIGASEFLQASRYYAIIFPNDTPTPVVLFTLAKQTNQYVQEDGSWSVPYIPAHIRRYPFILAKVEPKDENTEENRLALCIDRDAPHFQAAQGDILFTANGEVTDICKNALTFLEALQKDLHITLTLCKELEENEILVPRKVNVSQNGQTRVVEMFRVVDMDKLRSLDDATLAKWVRSGLISLVYLHIQSLGNLQAFTS